MINEDKTFELFGYTSDMLKQYSYKMIIAVCKFCGDERKITMRMHTKTNGRCRACYIQQIDCFGENTSFYGKSHTKKTKSKMSQSKQGIYDGDKNPMYGKHHSKETKRKQSEVLLGENSPLWKGGKKISRAKAKRRQLGFIPHNIPHENFHGHHVDFNHVIFVPKELHMSISHSVTNDKNMNEINDVVCDWYLEFQGLNL